MEVLEGRKKTHLLIDSFPDSFPHYTHAGQGAEVKQYFSPKGQLSVNICCSYKASSLEPGPYRVLKQLQAEDGISHPCLPPFLDGKEGRNQEGAGENDTGSNGFW